jgi:hypothetical protein
VTIASNNNVIEKNLEHRRHHPRGDNHLPQQIIILENHHPPRPARRIMPVSVPARITVPVSVEEQKEKVIVEMPKIIKRRKTGPEVSHVVTGV